MFDLVPFGEVIAFGFGLAVVGSALLVQCGGNKRNVPKKAKKKGGAGVKSKKSVRTSKKSQRKKPASVKSSRSDKSSKRSSRSQKKQRSSSRSSSKKKSASTAVASQPKKSKAKKRSASTQPSDLPIKEMSLKSLQETQKSVEENQQKHNLQIQAAQAGQLQSLKMEPRELHFNKQGGLLKVQLHNPSSVKQAVKAKCSDNNLYRVSPVYAYIEPGQQLNVYVMRQNGSTKLDKLVFVTVKATGESGELKKLFKEAPQQEMIVLPLFA